MSQLGGIGLRNGYGNTDCGHWPDLTARHRSVRLSSSDEANTVIDFGERPDRYLTGSVSSFQENRLELGPVVE